jgi:hypothetical protein
MVFARDAGVGRGGEPADRGRRQGDRLRCTRRVEVQQPRRGDRGGKDRGMAAVEAALAKARGSAALASRIFSNRRSLFATQSGVSSPRCSAPYARSSARSVRPAVFSHAATSAASFGSASTIRA